MIYTFLILGIFFPWFLGYILLSLDKNIGPIKYYLSFPFGIGILTYQLFFYSIIGIGFNVILIFLPWILTLSCLIYKKEIRFNEITIKNIIGSNKVNILLVFIIIFYSVFVFFGAFLDKNDHYDSLSIWSFKAKAFYMDGKVSQRFFDNSRNYSQFYYPLLVPLSQTWMAITYGKWNETVIKAVSPLFYVSLLGTFFYILININGQKWALYGTAILSSFPVIVKYAKLPIADIPLTFYLFISVSLFYLVFLRNKQIHFILPGFFLLFLEWTKNEGILLCFLAILFAIIYLLKEKKYNILLKVLAICGFLAIMNLPWNIFKNELGIHNPIVNIKALSSLNLGHIYFYTPIIINNFVNKMFLTVDWYGLWFIYLLMIFIYRKSIFNNHKDFVLKIINVSIFMYFSVYLLVKGDVNEFLS